MEPLVLVAYATRYGSTEETAREVAAELAQDGFAVEMRPVEQVTEWKQYSAVVIAAALYMGRLNKNARQFLERRHAELEQIPAALLVPGPVDREDKAFASAEQQLDKELQRLPWFHPVARKIVGGKWDPERMKFPFAWMLQKSPVKDARDWNAIRGWAHEVAGTFRPTLSH